MPSISRKEFLQLGLAAGAGRMLPLGIPGAVKCRPGTGPAMRMSDLSSSVQGEVLLPGDEGDDAERIPRVHRGA